MQAVSHATPIQAITLDLDDTLWPFPPIGERIERVLHGFHAGPPGGFRPQPALQAASVKSAERVDKIATQAHARGPC